MEKLELLTHSNPQENLKTIIPAIQKEVESYIEKYGENIKELNLEVLLTQDEMNQGWIIAHCYSILEYIKLFTRKDFTNLPDLENKTLNKTQEFISEFQHFNTILKESGHPAFFDDKHDILCLQVGLPTQVNSQSAFTSAKMKSHYENTPSVGQEYDRKITPFIIRHAIELKVKNDLLKIQYVEVQNKIKPIFISKYIKFLEEYSETFFNLPKDTISTISLVNKWANEFVHSGLHEYSWIIFSIIERIEPLFSIKEHSEINIYGFDFRKSPFNHNEFKTKLEDFLGSGYSVHLR